MRPNYGAPVFICKLTGFFLDRCCLLLTMQGKIWWAAFVKQVIYARLLSNFGY